MRVAADVNGGLLPSYQLAPGWLREIEHNNELVSSLPHIPLHQT
jgi:hypothetical protein